MMTKNTFINKLSKFNYFQKSMVLLVLLSTSIKAQTTEIQGNIKITNNRNVVKLITVKDCPETHTPPAGTTETEVSFETKYTNDKTEITTKDVVKPAVPGPVIIGVNKTIKKAMTPVEGKANLYIDDKDKSILFVNYFLNPTNEVPAGTDIQEVNIVHNCAGAPLLVPKPIRTLATSEKFDMWKVTAGSPEMAFEWFKNSNQIIVFKSPGVIDYYLVNRYDRDGKYVLQLKNRESIPYNSSSFDLGALTIPIKYRFGFKRNGIKISDDASASFNVGGYLGYKITKYSVINKEGTYINRNHASLRTGLFFNVGTTTLDSTSTTVGRVPITDADIKRNIATFSTGLALMADIKGLQLGLFGGWDFGVGPDAANWNYHNRFWLGFGFGYKLTDLFAKG